MPSSPPLPSQATPLHCAALNGQFQTIGLLLVRNADPNARGEPARAGACFYTGVRYLASHRNHRYLPDLSCSLSIRAACMCFVVGRIEWVQSYLENLCRRNPHHVVVALAWWIW